jgi:hypothetical protein
LYEVLIKNKKWLFTLEENLPYGNKTIQNFYHAVLFVVSREVRPSSEQLKGSEEGQLFKEKLANRKEKVKGSIKIFIFSFLY